MGDQSAIEWTEATWGRHGRVRRVLAGRGATAGRILVRYEQNSDGRLRVTSNEQAEEIERLTKERDLAIENMEHVVAEKQAAVTAERERAIGLVEAMICKRNVVGYDICDFCGDRWPAHRPDCEHGQLLAALRAPGPTA